MSVWTHRLTPIAIIALVLTACAAPTTRKTDLDPELVRQEEERQKQIALKKDRQYNDRLQRIAWPILKASVPL